MSDKKMQYSDEMQGYASSIPCTRAEQWPIRQGLADGPLDGREEIARLLEDLRLHQIELETQNEELRKAHDAASELKARYMRLFHQAPVGYLVINGNAIITYANETFATLVGKPLDKICGSPLADFIVLRDRPLFHARFRSLFKHPSGKEITLGLLSPGRGGQEIHASLTYSRVLAVDAQQNDELLVTVTDISQLIRARQEAEATQEFSRDILDSLDSQICVLDRQGEILNVNDAWQLFARNNGAVECSCGPGANYFHVCESARGAEREQALTCAAGIRAVLSGKTRRFSMEYECHAPDEERWFIARITRLTGSLGGHVVVAHENITERKHLERQALQQQMRINQMAKAESLSRLAGAIAHRFNNMLAAVLGNLELALDHVPPDGEAAVNLNMALQAGWKASELGGLMLTYLGQSVDLMEKVDLAEIVRYVLPQLRRSMPAQLQLKADLPPADIAIRGSVKLLQLAIANLVSNAGEAMEGMSEGQVSLAVGTVAAAAIAREIHRYPPDWHEAAREYACIAVGDSGCGIPPAQLDKIFDPFFTSKSVGRGMGLAVVGGILRAHGGVVTVVSEVGRGSTFRLYLPLL